jgi:protein-arginine kinase activator protein McsA
MPGAPASAPVQQTSTASVEKKVYDPMNNQPIRPKELVNLEFTPSKSSKSDDKEFNNRYMCPSCYKTFNNSFSDARAIQECGHVTCGECFKKFVAKESKCLVCSKKYKKTPITMQSASTGFANETVAVQAKTYNPSLGYM